MSVVSQFQRLSDVRVLTSRRATPMIPLGASAWDEGPV